MVGISAILLVSIFIYIWNKNKKKYISFEDTLDRAGIPIIEIECSNRKLYMVVDTGSALSHINKKISECLEYQELNGRAVSVGATGDKFVSTRCMLKININNKEYEGEFCISDLGVFDKYYELFGIRIDGMIGSDFLKKNKFLLDFNKLRMM